MREKISQHPNITWVIVLILNFIFVGVLSHFIPPQIPASWLLENFGLIGFFIGWVFIIGLLLLPISRTSDWILKKKGRSTNWTFLWFLGAPIWIKSKQK